MAVSACRVPGTSRRARRLGIPAAAESMLRSAEDRKIGCVDDGDRPPQRPQGLRTALELLRAAAHTSSAVPDAGLRSIDTRVADLEHRVSAQAGTTFRRRARSVPASSYGVDEIAEVLGRDVLVSYFVRDSTLHSVSVVDGRLRVATHGDAQVSTGEAHWLRECLGRLATGCDPRMADAYGAAASRTGRGLARNLLAPVRAELARGRGLVVVPTGALYTLPWAALARRGTAVTVAPSIRCFLRAAHRSGEITAGDRSVWIAGPGLEHADREVRALHAASGGSLLLGKAATADRILHTVDGAGLAHIAAHGWFRADRPMLSCMDVSDGPLYGYDLTGLRRGPATVVLSACEVGRSAVSGRDRLSGLAAALLERGTTTVIAGVVPVPDERTAQVMVDLHAALRGGLSPVRALARAQSRHGERGFVCLGYGGKR